MLSFNVKKAASLADFTDKSFSGIDFPDDGLPETFHATFGAIANNKIDFSISLQLPKVIGSGGLNITSLGTPSASTNPAYADFTTSPAGYSSSPLATAYPVPKDIPALFELGKLLDTGRVILAAMKFNNKVITIGMAVNYHDSNDTNPSMRIIGAATGMFWLERRLGRVVWRNNPHRRNRRR